MSLLTAAPSFLAQTSAQAAPAVPGASGGMSMFITMGLFVAAMYFLMIAPQRKKQKEHDKLLKSLKSGDDVITSSGIFGTITNVKEDRFVVRISDNVKVELAKGFVQTVVKRADGGDVK